MLFVNYKINAPKSEVLKNLLDTERVVSKEKYDTSFTTSKMHIKQNGDTIKIKCEYIGRQTKDNGFLQGTFLRAKIVEREGITCLRGVILTEPVYHLVMLLLFLFFIYQCVSLGGFSIVPICLLIFSIFMLKDEFKKQKLIDRYVLRAMKLTYKSIGERKVQ